MTKNTVNVSVMYRKTTALCDTGASISCVSKTFLDKVFPSEKPNIESSSIKTITGVGGTQHAVDGVLDLDVNFGGLIVGHPFYVISDLHHSLILGHDFMESNNVEINYKTKSFHIQDSLKVCNLTTNTGYARTVKSIDLPPNCEMDIPVKIARVNSNEQILLEPLASLANQNIMGAKCLVKVKKGKAILRLINPTEQTITLKNNKVLAVASEINNKYIFTLTETEQSQSNNFSSSKQKVKTKKFDFNFENSDLSESQKEDLLKLLHKNSDIFAEGLHDLGRTHLVTHKVHTGDSPPVKLPFYKQTPQMRRKTKELTDEMLKTNQIKETNSNWHSPVVLVRKANTDEYRFAVDYRKLNKISKPQDYPIPRLADIFDAIGEANAQYFTSLDLGKAFWQVPLDEESKEKCSFITYDGIFTPQNMPFGLSGAPATFQNLMMKVLRGISWKYVLCYVDDCIIFSSNFQQHLGHINEVFSRFRQAGLKLSPKKCFFAQKKLYYLGHVISKDGVQTDERKVEKIKKLSPPKDQKGVKSLLGLTNYYKKFISGYSKICAPITELLKKDVKFVWSEKCDKALETLKQALSSAPILAFPDMNKSFILTCDASYLGLGYILGQVDENGKERVIEYGGRALHGSEKNYSASELECLAIVTGVKTYKSYLSTGLPFTIYTDHKALKCLNSLTVSSNARLARWALFLQGFKYKVEYIKGKHNSADVLSRSTDESQIKQNTTPTIINENSNMAKSPNSFKDAYVNENQVLEHDKEDVPVLSVEVSDKISKKEWLEVNFQYETDNPVLSVDVQSPLEEKLENDTELIKLQKTCPEFKDMYLYLSSNILPDDEKQRNFIIYNQDQFHIVDGILLHKYQPRVKKKPTDEKLIFQIALPSQLRLKAMQSYHDFNGHFGIKKTFSALQAKYYWRHMCQDITDFVKSCERCQFAKKNSHPHSTPLNPLPVVKVFERMHIDILGPLTKTVDGHEYILVCVDSFSRWVEAFPLFTQSATEIARVLHDEIFCRYGACLSLVTDRGRNFLSKLINAICEVYKVSRHKTASYNPQANGCVERQNAVIAQILRMYINEKKNDWHLILPTVLMSIRSSPNTETSGFSPFKMLFGKEMRLPFDTDLVPRESLGPEAKTFMTQLLDNLKTVHSHATMNSEMTQRDSKQRHDAKAKESNFSLAEKVLLKINKRTPGLTNKLQIKWEGPYYITQKGPHDTYRIADCETHKARKALVNAKNLKKYHDPRNYRQDLPLSQPDDLQTHNDSHINNEHNNTNKNNGHDTTNSNKANSQVQNKEQDKGNRSRPSSNSNQNDDDDDDDDDNNDDNNNDLDGNNNDSDDDSDNNDNSGEDDDDDSDDDSNWLDAVKILKQRKWGNKKYFLVQWADPKIKPSWEAEEDCSEMLLRAFYVKHTLTGRRRKRPTKYKYFDKV